MKIRNIILSFIIFVFAIGNFRCCEEISVLCDLVVDLFQTPEQITIGQSFNILADVLNQDSGEKCDVVELANSTYSLVEVFLENSNGGWDLAGAQDYLQDALEVSEHFNLEDLITINQSGNYRFDFYTDSPQTVDERDENNNNASDNSDGKTPDIKAAMRKTNNYAFYYTYAAPTPDGRATIQDKPIVEFK